MAAIFDKKYKAGSLFFLIYALLLLPISKGIGNYWDWVFPYFTEGLKNYGSGYQSLVNDNLGTPLSYASNLYFSKLVSFLGRTTIPTELLLYFLLVFLLTAASFAFYCLARRRVNVFFSFIFGLAVVTNPAIFYKLLAGHLNYLVSYALFVILITFTFNGLKNNLKSALILGLILGFIGIQIQFFLFAFLYIILFLIVLRPNFNWKYITISFVLPFLINLPWLTNFILGVNSVTGIGSAAASVGFTGSMQASFLRLAAMVFSNATVIQYVYPRWSFLYFLIFFLVVISACVVWVLRKRKTTPEENKPIIFSLSLLSVFFILGTGFFYRIPSQFIQVFFSIFRESGHFAPIIILCEFLSLLYLLPFLSTKRILKIAFAIYLIGFIGLNAYFFVRYLPKVNYSMERSKFTEINDFDKKELGSYRILTYPFWNQYGFLDTREIEKNGRLLNNSGWDSYTVFSGKDFINNYAPGGKNIEDTLQYRLLETDKLTELEQQNIKYIYDLSGIYESNFDRYTSPGTYDDDLSLIKNDPDFFNKLIQNNPDKISKIQDDIYELSDYLPRIYLNGNSEAQLYFQKINPTEYKISIKGLKSQTDLIFLNNFHRGWQLYPEPINHDGVLSDNCGIIDAPASAKSFECRTKEKLLTSAITIFHPFSQNLFDESHKDVLDYANQWRLDPNIVKTNPGSNFYKTNEDGTIDLELKLYFWPQTYFVYSLAVSLIALVMCLSCVFFPWLRRNQIK